jgi:hypothetical protein
MNLRGPRSCYIWACNNESLCVDPQCFCCTTLRDVTFVEWSFISVISMTCVRQLAVVCWVTTAGIRAIALTLDWKPIKWVEPVGVLIGIVKSSLRNMVDIHLRITLPYILVR